MEPESAAGKMRGGARADGPTGGRLVLKKGADRDVEFHTRARQAAARPEPETRPSQKKPRRRCRFCRTPLLFISAPLILVLVFVLRGQRAGEPGESGTLSGHVVTLSALAAGPDAVVTLVVRPLKPLLARLARIEPAPAGTPIAAAIYAAFAEGGPEMLFGSTTSGGEPVTILSSRVTASAGRSSGEYPEIRAEISIGSRALTLSTRVKTN